MDLGLTGKIALVTGGTRGIGRAIALTLAGEGCLVAVCARHDPDEGIKPCLFIPGDVMMDADRVKVVARVFAQWGALHILVNNAGGGGRWGSSPEDTDQQVWEGVYKKNALAAVDFTMMALPGMVKQRWGRVVSIASIYGKEAGTAPWFTMAKAAEIALMKDLAIRGYLGITFNSIAPGHIKVDKEGEEDWLGPWGEPQDIANLVVFLCSDKAKHINGACLVVDGGESRSF